MRNHIRKAVSILLLCPLALVTCVIESTDKTIAIIGEPCVDGITCGRGLFCFIATGDPESGTCIEPPDACDGTMSCDCLDELDAECTTNTKLCFGLIGDFTVACTQAGSRRQLGETCAMLIPCEPGLLCVIPGEGVAGTCQAQPDCASLDCDCLEQVKDTACPREGWACFIAGARATLQCY